MRHTVTLKRVGETKNFYVFEDRKSAICNKVYVEKETFGAEDPTEAQFEISTKVSAVKNVTEIG